MKVVASILAGLAVLGAASSARAQLNWDASAKIGGMKRFLSNRPTGGGDAGFGPVGELTGHIALLPLVRVGAYVAHDIMPTPGDTKAYQLTVAGLRVKVTSPIPHDNWRIWGFAGLGYGGVYGPSFHSPVDVGGTRTDALADGASGSFFEIPVGVGASYKIWRFWHLTAELAGRFGFGFGGTLYGDTRPASATNQPPLSFETAGTNPVGLSLMVGVMLDP